jgi:hypothetical protein
MIKLVVAFHNFANAIRNSTLCPHIVIICFVWISEQTAIISLYSINWFYNRDGKRLLRGTDWIFTNIGQGTFLTA